MLSREECGSRWNYSVYMTTKFLNMLNWAGYYIVTVPLALMSLGCQLMSEGLEHVISFLYACHEWVSKQLLKAMTKFVKPIVEEKHD